MAAEPERKGGRRLLAPEDRGDSSFHRFAASPVMGEMAKRTGIDSKRLSVFAIAIPPLIFLLLFGLHALCEVAAFVYPAYKTFKILRKKTSAPSVRKRKRPEDSPSGTRSLDESGTGEEGEEEEDEPGLPVNQELPVDQYLQDQHIVWLTYWVVYGVYDSVEYFTDRIFFWFPGYTLFKALFLLFTFIQIKGERGCVLIYGVAVRPLFVRYRTHIETAIREGMKGMSQAGSEVVVVGSSAFTKAFSTVISPQTLAEKAGSLSFKVMQAAAQRSASPTPTEPASPTEPETVPPDGKKLM